MTEIRTADPGTRTRVLRLALVIFLAGFVLISLMLMQREALILWLENNLETLLAYPWLVFVFMLILFSPLIAYGAWLLGYANQILDAREFPPPGITVSRDTPVYRGDEAIKRARVLQGLALCLTLACLAAAILTQWIVVSFLA